MVLPVLLITACQPSPSLPPPVVQDGGLVLEGAVGPYIQKLQIGADEARLGTGVVLKLRTAAGTPPTSPVEVSVTGPAGWRDNQPLKFSYPAGGQWYVQPDTNAAPLTGDYTVEVSLNGNVQRLKTRITDDKSILTLANPSGRLIDQAIRVSWNAVVGAQGYFAQIRDATDAVAVAEAYVKSTTVDLKVPALPTNHNYYALLYATNFDTTLDNPVLPAQLAVSDSVGPVSLQPQQLSLNSLVRRFPAGFGR